MHQGTLWLLQHATTGCRTSCLSPQKHQTGTNWVSSSWISQVNIKHLQRNYLRPKPRLRQWPHHKRETISFNPPFLHCSSRPSKRFKRKMHSNGRGCWVEEIRSPQILSRINHFMSLELSGWHTFLVTVCEGEMGHPHSHSIRFLWQAAIRWLSLHKPH